MLQVRCSCDGETVLVQDRDEAERTAMELAGDKACPCDIVDTSGAVLATIQPRGVKRGEPPSTYAILAALEGDRTAWERVAWLTLLRAGLIAPGLWLTGARGWRLLLGSVAGSATVTGSLMAWYAFKHREQEEAPE